MTARASTSHRVGARPDARPASARPMPSGPRCARPSRTCSRWPRPVNDLRARIEQIVARDRARHDRGAASQSAVTERTPPQPWSLVADASAQDPAIPWEVREQRLAVDDLGLEVVGRGAADPLLLAHLGLKGEPPRRWSDILFLDTETTGLAGGTGTYVFLIGVAHIAEGELVLRQHLLRDLGAETTFVEHLKAEMEPFRACASYNGQTFDLPLLRTRFVMALRSELTVDESHLDLLHPARRLWKDRFGSTTLRQLEESVLDDARVPDIAGSLIPDAYFHYLRTRAESVIGPVLEHNARDVVSLVRIADRVASAVLEARAGRAPTHAPAAFALARGF